MAGDQFKYLVQKGEEFGLRHALHQCSPLWSKRPLCRETNKVRRSHANYFCPRHTTATAFKCASLYMGAPSELIQTEVYDCATGVRRWRRGQLYALAKLAGWTSPSCSSSLPALKS
eukprot:9468258-Pyramimonas_sp.AAC.1